MYFFKILLAALLIFLLNSCEEEFPISSEPLYNILNMAEIQAPALLFKRTYANDRVVKELVIKNTSDKAASEVNYRLSSPYFKILNAETCTSIDPQQNCRLEVEFTPQKSQKNYSEVITVSYVIDKQTKTAEIALSGSSTDENMPTGQGSLEISNNHFGTINFAQTDKISVNLIIKNNYKQSVSGFQLVNNFQKLFVVEPTSTCKFTTILSPDATCTIVLTTTSMLSVYNELRTLSYKTANQTITTDFYITGKGDPKKVDNLKQELTNLLKTRTFDDSQIKHTKKDFWWNNTHYSVSATGEFFAKNISGRHGLNLQWHNSNYHIFDKTGLANLVTNPLDVGADLNVKNTFAGMALAIREHGIYSMKSINPECYYAYAASRLKTDNPYLRLMAMERAINPRPLFFKNDEEWEDFKKDIREIFKEFRSPQSHVVILGTGTTFFSQNPTKGMSDILFESAPACLASAKNPSRALNAYTFDTPGAPMSDLDVHIFIPKLSELCHQANVAGNSGKRPAYWENTLNRCVVKSTNPSVRAMVDPIKNLPDVFLPNALNPNSSLGKFFTKWGNALDHREINFSIHIRPDQLAFPLTRPAEHDFENDPALKRPFVIDIN